MGQTVKPWESVSGIPEGSCKWPLNRLPCAGRRARTSSLSQAAKQMKDARHHIRVDTRPRMTLRDFKAAARAHASRKSPVSSTNRDDDARKASSKALQAAVPEAADGRLNGFSHASEAPTAATDKGQAWRSYQSSQTGTAQDTSPTEGSDAQQAASLDSTADRPRPATADLDEYLSRQHHARPGAPADASNGPGPCASVGADKDSASAWRDCQSDAGSASHAPISSAAQPSQATHLRDRLDAPASSTPADTPQGAAQAVRQDEHADRSRTAVTGTIPVPQTEAGGSSFMSTFGQQSASDGGQSKHQPVFAMPGWTQAPSPPNSGVTFGAPPAAGTSAAGKARPKAQRSPRRSTAQAFRPGGAAPVFMFSSPATKQSQQPSGTSAHPTSFTFGATPTAEQPKQPPQGTSSAWPDAGVKQPQSMFTASASQASHAGSSSAGPAGQNVSRGSAASWPEPGTFFMPAPPTSNPGCNTQTAQQGQAPAQKQPAFTFGQQPEPQQAAAGGPVAQQQPDPGSARARGFTFGLGSQNVPPAQASARPFKGRSGGHAAKGATLHAAKHQPDAATAQDAPAYSQPGPRKTIPVRCSNHFESPVQSAECQSPQFAFRYSKNVGSRESQQGCISGVFKSDEGAYNTQHELRVVFSETGGGLEEHS